MNDVVSESGMPTPVVTTLTAAQRRLLLFVAYLGRPTNWTAFLLRFDEVIPASQWELFVSMLPLLLGIRALALYPFRLL